MYFKAGVFKPGTPRGAPECSKGSPEKKKRESKSSTEEYCSLISTNNMLSLHHHTNKWSNN